MVLALASSWATKITECWLLQTLKTIWPPPPKGACEKSCAELLALLVQDGALAGIRLSLPWREFFGEFRKPSNPAQRVPSNLSRFAGNYINVILGCYALTSFGRHPVL